MSNLTIWEDKNELNTIKEIYGKHLTNNEFTTFLKIGMNAGLNPFLGEIYAIKYGQNNPANIFASRNGYRKVAASHPDYDGHFAVSVYSNDEFEVHNGIPKHKFSMKDRGDLVGAFAVVHKKNTSIPCFVYVELKEYDTSKSVWASKPETMIKKVAESQCLRMAFPSKLSGTYSEDEEWEVRKNTMKSAQKLYPSKSYESKADMIIDSFEDVEETPQGSGKREAHLIEDEMVRNLVERLYNYDVDDEVIAEKLGVDYITYLDESHIKAITEYGIILKENEEEMNSLQKMAS